jgi:Rod binding domain-containing protein
MDIKAGSPFYSSQARPAYATGSRKDLRLAESCQDFESVFLTTLWRNMAKNSGIEFGGWDVMLSQAMGKAWAQAGGIGLAKVLYKQLSKSSSENVSGDDAGEANSRVGQ